MGCRGERLGFGAQRRRSDGGESTGIQPPGLPVDRGEVSGHQAECRPLQIHSVSGPHPRSALIPDTRLEDWPQTDARMTIILSNETPTFRKRFHSTVLKKGGGTKKSAFSLL